MFSRILREMPIRLSLTCFANIKVVTQPCRLIASKNRVSPVKAVTVPCLELMGAVLSARLATSLRKVITVNATTFWTHSTNVLFWVHNRSRTFKPFVANRVGRDPGTNHPRRVATCPRGHESR